jgi:TRAP-type uncharacterized transport system substrate-binding protein
MNAVRLPRWLRIFVVIGCIVLAGGAGLFGYRWYARPTTLTIAVGTLDREANNLLNILAGKLTLARAPVRLNIVETSSVLESANLFAAGKVDLAVVRGDVGDLSQAKTVLVVAHAVALLLAPAGSTASNLSDLKKTTIGVVGGDANRKLMDVLTAEYDLGRVNVTFKTLAPADLRQAIDNKDVRAALLVVPLTEKYLAIARGLFPQGKNGPTVIGIESAGAIADKEGAYESFDIPKGTLRGSPAVPADDVTTLRTTFYLVAQKKLGSDLVADLTEALMNARRDALAELPIASQISQPELGPDAYLPVHPGAAAFYNGTRESFLDKWGNAIFLAPMIAGGLLSIMAAAWKFMRLGETTTEEEALDVLYALGPRIRAAGLAELDEIEGKIDAVLRTHRHSAAGDSSDRDITAVNVAAHRLENLIHDRREALKASAS